MIFDVLQQSMMLIMSGDASLYEIITLSLGVSLLAVFIACLIGLPLGAVVGAFNFPAKPVIRLIFNALMGLPPVVVGLIVYLLLSASGPFGVLGLLYTPTAMVIAQIVLVTPIIAALTTQVVEDLHDEYRDQFASFGVGPILRVRALLWDARFSLMTVALAGFGRAIAEVGAVMIVGGNINHVTRVMTTTIALETSKGNLQLALALGLVLLMIAIAVNAVVMSLRASAARFAYA